ncbi:MAG: ribosomal protein L18e/L15 [Cenarchaeum symbiont of Oopsacas minuta]|nr:ribosomal protein L18e/L15 [Cenarchaeum symbiont of Oopsacas minuta]
MKVRPSMSRTVSVLEKTSNDNDSPIWSKLVKMAKGKTSTKRVINIKKIAKYTSDGDSVIVPGKVLGTGSISHKIILYSFSISDSAANRIMAAGGSVKPISDAIKNHPTGKGLIMLG